MKAHITDKEIDEETFRETKMYKNYRGDTITIGEVLDTYEWAKSFMINRVTKTHGKDVSKWPKDIQEEMRTTFSATDMVRDIMMALYKQQKEEKAASADEHSPVDKTIYGKTAATSICDEGYIDDEKILEEAAHENKE